MALNSASDTTPTVNNKSETERVKDRLAQHHATGVVVFESYGVYHRDNQMHIKKHFVDTTTADQQRHNHLDVTAVSIVSIASTAGNLLLTRTADESSGEQYDRVLVDAECTHDGSFKHILKWCRRTGDANRTAGCCFEQADEERLWNLQRRLIQNGFDLLRPGGRLVYSTCSLSKRQNEEVVDWFLHKNAGQVRLLRVGVDVRWPSTAQVVPPCKEGAIPGTVRFDPQTSNTGGLFIAVFQRVGNADQCAV